MTEPETIPETEPVAEMGEAELRAAINHLQSKLAPLGGGVWASCRGDAQFRGPDKAFSIVVEFERFKGSKWFHAPNWTFAIAEAAAAIESFLESRATNTPRRLALAVLELALAVLEMDLASEPVTWDKLLAKGFAAADLHADLSAALAVANSAGGNIVVEE